ncbi:MAG: lysophospholipid acyltransferase family protein [Candidatus Omnitrophica bacterium]|nr:lysophospholipid acyltransferase family protein [Candidatus Omnitrophota bacterium]
MKHKPYRTALYVLARIIGTLIYPLPLKAGVRLGALMGKLAFHIVPKERRKTLAHLRMALGRERSEKELRKIAKDLFANMGRNAIEWINYPKFDKEWFSKNIYPENFERVRNAYDRGKGLIVLTGHLGNWELLGSYLSFNNYAGTMIAKKIYIKQFDEFFVRMRKHFKNDILYRGESPKKVLRVLKSGGIIGILPDQDISSIEGIFVDFFGKPAYTPTAPVKFAIKTGAALVPMFALRDGDRFKFLVEKEIVMEITGDKDRDLLVNTIKWMRVFENVIRRYPDQWVWMHRRWKTKPEDKNQ